MPPNENKKLNNVNAARTERRATSEIVDRRPIPQPERLIGFFSADIVDAAFQAADFDIMEEVAIAASVARSPDQRLSMSALSHLRKIAKDSAAASGLFGTVSQTETRRDEDGTEVRRISSANTLLNRIQKDKQLYAEVTEDREYRAIRHPALVAGRKADPLHAGPPAVPDGGEPVVGAGLHEPGSPTGDPQPAGTPHPDNAHEPRPDPHPRSPQDGTIPGTQELDPFDG